MSWRFGARVDHALNAAAQLRDQLRRELPVGHACEEILLVASELTTNAVLHGRQPVDVQVTVDGDVARVVHDAHPQMGVLAEDSRGLLLIEHIARAWGVSRKPGHGKMVWAEISLREAT